MNELTLDGKNYVSSKRAAEITGYAKDYIGQLCREGHVEARLVGRNWYVLESSIKAHRFGAVSATSESDMVVQSWPKAKYIAEQPSPLPVFESRAVDDLEVVVPTETNSAPQRGAILTDMESAWREWFTQKDESSLKQEVPAVESEEFIPESLPEEEIVQEESVEEDLPTEIVHIHSLNNHPVLDLASADVDEEGIIVEERVVTTRRPSPILGNLVIQSAFIGTALIVAALAVVGTGYAQRIIGSNLYRLPEINFIAGVSEINK